MTGHWPCLIRRRYPAISGIDINASEINHPKQGRLLITNQIFCFESFSLYLMPASASQIKEGEKLFSPVLSKGIDMKKVLKAIK